MLCADLMGVLLAQRATHDCTMQLLVTTGTWCRDGREVGLNCCWPQLSGCVLGNRWRCFPRVFVREFPAITCLLLFSSTCDLRTVYLQSVRRCEVIRSFSSTGIPRPLSAGGAQPMGRLRGFDMVSMREKNEGGMCKLIPY